CASSELYGCYPLICFCVDYCISLAAQVGYIDLIFLARVGDAVRIIPCRSASYDRETLVINYRQLVGAGSRSINSMQFRNGEHSMHALQVFHVENYRLLVNIKNGNEIRAEMSDIEPPAATV